ncbi:MAG TPA: hypothetical protein DEV81_21075 [Cyanobacteria bacterium UBA11049]|nr:hypothetical protein [Cyanobacteria bacterium UBA11049]
MAARSFTITVENFTSHVWQYVGSSGNRVNSREGGSEFTPEQILKIRGNEEGDAIPGVVSFSSEYSPFPASTKAVIYYEDQFGGVLHIAWKNPFVGSNRFTVAVPPGLTYSYGDIHGNNVNVTVTIRERMTPEDTQKLQAYIQGFTQKLLDDRHTKFIGVFAMQELEKLVRQQIPLDFTHTNHHLIHKLMTPEDIQQLEAYIQGIYTENTTLDSVEAFRHSVCQQILLDFILRQPLFRQQHRRAQLCNRDEEDNATSAGEVIELTLQEDNSVTGRLLISFQGLAENTDLASLTLTKIAEILVTLRENELTDDADLVEAYLNAADPDWQNKIASEIGVEDNVTPQLWEILGLSPGASIEEVKKAYRQIMPKVHSDTSGLPQWYAQTVNDAYRKLLEEFENDE